MGLFDKIRDETSRLSSKVQGATGGTKFFNEVRRLTNKVGFKDTSMKNARRGRLNSNDWLSNSPLFSGLANRSTLNSLTTFAQDPTNDRKFLKGAKTGVMSVGTSAYAANLGHQAIGREPGEGPDAPGATPLPPVGTGTRNARQRARQSAIDAARRRFGVGDTVATTPLGLQGDGASLGKKRLTGE